MSRLKQENASLKCKNPALLAGGGKMIDAINLPRSWHGEHLLFSRGFPRQNYGR
jgi:hypothetical protein